MFEVIDKNRADKEKNLTKSSNLIASSSKTKLVSKEGISIDVKSLWFSYPSQPEHPVLKGVTIAIPPHQLVAFAGKSGSGKSTLLSIISGLYTCQKGDIVVNDRNLTDVNHEFLKDEVRQALIQMSWRTHVFNYYAVPIICRLVL